MADDITLDDEQHRWDEYTKHREQAWKDINASSDEFDKSLLTFSSGILGLSLAFIKDIVKLDHAVALPTLYWSWVLLTLCIVTTIFSYRCSYQALIKHLDNLESYFLKRNESALNRETLWSGAVEICARVGAILFLAGVVLTVIFVYLNVSQEHRMTDPKAQKVATVIVPNVQPTNIMERGRAPMPVTPIQSQGTGPAATTAQPKSSSPVTVTPLKKD